ncbi:MAG: glycoside hydrolase family 15 protein [Thermomicrobiales bacterium]
MAASPRLTTAKPSDASALLLPMLHFIKGDDLKMASTVDTIQKRLTHNGLVYRYRVEETDEGVSGHEGTFTICSFWMVDNLAFLGRVEEARDLFSKLINYSNDLGLYWKRSTRPAANFSAISRRHSPTWHRSTPSISTRPSANSRKARTVR